jgi:DNA-binding winged helix-turn-helix (wHTH) protein
VHVESLIGQIIHGLRSLLEGKREEAIATIQGNCFL